MDYIIYIFLVPVLVLVVIIIGIVALFTNRNSHANNMESNQMSPKTSAKDFSLNLGAFIALYTLIASLLNLLFTIIEKAYPKITDTYNYYGSSTSPISMPVSILIVFFPIFILLMYFLEREYRTEPEKQNNSVHRGLTYITLFVSAIVVVGDLITVVYYFIDGQELTTGFLLKVLVLLVVACSIFVYYINDLRGKLTSKSRIFWRIFAGVILAGSIVWAFSVLGSPRTQQLIKYDQQKVSDLQSLNYQVQNFYQTHASLPSSINDLGCAQSFNNPGTCADKQTGKQYEYNKVSATEYSLCAEFNKDLKDANNAQIQTYPYIDSAVQINWNHPAGHYCFKETMNPSQYPTKPTSPYYPQTVPVQ